MKKYKVIKRNGSFHLIEKETDHTIRSNRNKEILMELAKSLEAGAGFAGWTPQFIVDKFRRA